MNKQSEKLAKAIAYEAKKKKERDEDKRPAFHVTPTTGWCNDPNGFSRNTDKTDDIPHQIGKIICFISIIHMKINGVRCTGDIAGQKILSNGKNFHVCWHRIWNTMVRDVFPEQQWNMKENIF